MKPKKQQSKKKRRERHKAPLTRKQRIRQQIRERMLQAKAAAIEVWVVCSPLSLFSEMLVIILFW